MKTLKKRKDSSDEILKEIGKRLKTVRKTKFKNYEHIAFELGMSRSQYWGYEAGKNIELKTLLRILRVLDVSIVEFFTGLELPKKLS